MKLTELQAILGEQVQKIRIGHENPETFYSFLLT